MLLLFGFPPLESWHLNQLKKNPKKQEFVILYLPTSTINPFEGRHFCHHQYTDKVTFFFF